MNVAKKRKRKRKRKKKQAYCFKYICIFIFIYLYIYFILTYNLTKINNSFIISSTKVGLVAVEGIDV
jgi:hypothetical protein